MLHTQWQCTHASDRCGLFYHTEIDMSNPAVVAAAETGLAAIGEKCTSNLDLFQGLKGPCLSSLNCQTEVSVDTVIALAATYFACHILLIRKLRSYRRQAYTVVQVGIVYNTLQVPVPFEVSIMLLLLQLLS